MGSYRIIPLNGGDFSIHSDSGYLHSRRNPRKEAERIAREAIGNSGISSRVDTGRPIYVICVNPGLGYLAETIVRHYPRAIVLGVYSDSVLLDAVRDHSPERLKFFTGPVFALSSPDKISGKELTILEYAVEDLRMMNSLVIPWPGARHVPGNDALMKKIGEIMWSSQKQLQTKMYFGPLWMKNYRRNLQRLSSSRKHNSSREIPGLNMPGPATVPRKFQRRGIILCASGPSLEASLPLLQEYIANGHLSFRPEIWALPSALRALQHWNIPVDTVVSIDGGYWAGVHLNHAPPSAALHISMSAAIPQRLFSRFRDRIVPFSLRMPFEQEGCSLESFPERGSVLFTALDQITQNYRGSCIILGADFTDRQGRSHCRPHSFDEFIVSRCSRTRPLEHELFLRTRGDQLDVYAEWFETHLSRMSGLYRLRNTGRVLNTPEVTSLAEAWKMLERSPPFPSSPPPASISGCGIDPPPTHAEYERLFTRFHSSTGFFEHPHTIDSHSQQVMQRLLYSQGIELKNAHASWLSGEDEANCLRRVLEQKSPEGRKDPHSHLKGESQ